VSTENDHGRVAVIRGQDHVVVKEEERKEADLGMLILLTIVLLELVVKFLAHGDMKIIVFEQK
jgi:hypothetical protein